MFLKQAALQKFGESGLRELIGVQISHLLDEAKAFNGGGGSNDPANAQAGESDFGEAVNVDDEVGAVELLERRNALVAGVQAGVDVVLDDGNLIARSEFQNAAPRGERHGHAGRIVEIGREDQKLDAISGERSFEGFEVDAESAAGFSVGADRNAEATGA